MCIWIVWGGGGGSSNKNASRNESVEAGDESVETRDESIEAGEKHNNHVIILNTCMVLHSGKCVQSKFQNIYCLSVITSWMSNYAHSTLFDVNTTPAPKKLWLLLLTRNLNSWLV